MELDINNTRVNMRLRINVERSMYLMRERHS